MAQEPQQIVVRKMVQLPTADVEWLQSVYGRDCLSWALSLMLGEFRAAHKHTPQDYAKIGAASLYEAIDEKIL